MSCSIARAVLRYIAPGFIAANWAAPMSPSVSGVTTACTETTSHSREHRVEVVVVVASGLYGSYDSTRMPTPAKRHGGRAPDRAEADDPDGPARELPGAVALVGDLAAGVHLARAHVAVGGNDPAVHREHQRDRELGDRVGVAAGRAQHGDPGRGRGRDVDVVGIAPARPDHLQREVEDRSLHEVRLDDQDVRAFVAQPGRELLAVVEPERDLLDPRVVHDVRHRLQGVHAGAAERRGDEGDGSGCHLAILARG